MLFDLNRARSRKTAASALIVVLALAACQPMPHPFERDGRAPANPLVALSDRAGIVVLDVDGAPAETAKAFPKAMIDALLRRNITATAAGGNRGSSFLHGLATARKLATAEGWVEVEIAWELADFSGRTIGRHIITGKARRADWQAGAPGLVKRFAEAAADGVAKFIQDPAPRNIVSRAEMRPLHVIPVAGAPGDGGRALRVAMTAALRRARLNVTPESRPDSLVVAGSVSMGAVERGRRTIEIEWVVLRPDGSEIGKLTQRNAVPEGALDRRWGRLADIVAEAAVAGVIDILRQRPEDARQNAARDDG